MNETIEIKTPEIFGDTECLIAENPLWDERSSTLYWRGSHGELFRRKTNDPDAEMEMVQLPDIIGGFVFGEKEGELILLGEKGRIQHYQWGGEPNVIAVMPGAHDGTLINDVIAAPDGSIFFGVLKDYYFQPEKQAGKPGSLWQFTPDQKFIRLEADAGETPNGMAFSNDRSKYYFAVTDHRCIYEYDYPAMTGKHIFISPGHSADGITIDGEGRLWETDCGKHIYCYSPEGELLKTYYFPRIWGITSVIIGDRVYFTTMNFARSKDFPMGKVYALDADCTPVPEFRINVLTNCAAVQ